MCPCVANSQVCIFSQEKKANKWLTRAHYSSLHILPHSIEAECAKELMQTFRLIRLIVCEEFFFVLLGGTNECINSQKSNHIYLLQTATLLLKIVCTQEKTMTIKNNSGPQLALFQMPALSFVESVAV